MNQSTTQTPELSPLGTLLVSSLARLDAYEAQLSRQAKRDTITVATVGSRVTSAYEQLRNASEYGESSFFRLRAIRRFLARELSFHERRTIKDLADELLVELTQAGYLPNGSVSKAQLKQIAGYCKKYYTAYWNYTKIESAYKKQQQFKGWMLDTLSVRCEQALANRARHMAFTQFAFTYLYDRLDIAQLLQPDEAIEPENHPVLLFIAIQKTILKLDDIEIRANLLDSYKHDINLIHRFESFNQTIDKLFDTRSLQRLGRVVSKNGAVLRFIYTGFYAENAPMNAKSLTSPGTLDYAAKRHIERSYAKLDSMLDSGIFKSVLFLLITKSIIGLAIEVPYDLAVFGHIVWLPLLINLFFPSIFIMLSRLAITVPGHRNTEEIVNQMTDLLFADGTPPRLRLPSQNGSLGLNILYGFTFAVAFALLSWVLYSLHFTLVQGAIFFVFLCTASFLAFRLSHEVRQVEASAHVASSTSLLHDIIYLPFIYMGQQISFRYSRINIVSHLFDLIIELPLKAVLRSIRRWTVFLSSKRDEIL